MIAAKPGPWRAVPQHGIQSGRVTSWLVSRYNAAASHGADTLRDDRGRGMVFRSEAAALAAIANLTGAAS